MVLEKLTVGQRYIMKSPGHEREGLGCQARCTLDLSLFSSRRLDIDFERGSIVDSVRVAEATAGVLGLGVSSS